MIASSGSTNRWFDPLHHFRYGRMVPLVLALLFISWINMMLLGGLLRLLIETPPVWIEEAAGLSGTVPDEPIIHEAVTVLLLAPIVEELFFRGYLLHRFTRKWNVNRAIWVSSILFAILHADMLATLVFALAASVLYLRTRSLLVPIALHLMNNLVPFTAMALLRLIESADKAGGAAGVGAAGGSAGDPGGIIAGIGCVGVVALLVVVPVAKYLNRFIRQNWPEEGRVLPYFADFREYDTHVFWKN